MIILDDGYTIEGTVDNSIVKLNDEWVKIVVIKTNLSRDEAENLFIENNKLEYGNIVYISDGYIKTVQENNITYTWLRFKYSYIKENQTELIDKLIEDNINMQMQIDTLILSSL